MHIHEAIQAASAAEPYITRASWHGRILKAGKVYATLAVLPTSSPDGCIYHSQWSGAQPGWKPTADDLTAEDWEVAIPFNPAALKSPQLSQTLQLY